MDRTSNEVDNSLAESFTFCNEAKDLELFRVSVSYTGSRELTLPPVRVQSIKNEMKKKTGVMPNHAGR